MCLWVSSQRLGRCWLLVTQTHTSRRSHCCSGRPEVASSHAGLGFLGSCMSLTTCSCTWCDRKRVQEQSDWLSGSFVSVAVARSCCQLRSTDMCGHVLYVKADVVQSGLLPMLTFVCVVWCCVH
jgi:hypothetical protein